MIVKNEELLVLLKEAGTLVKEIRGIGGEMEILEEARNKKAIAHQKLKDKIFPIVKAYGAQLGEYEDIEGVEIVEVDKKETDEINIRTIDRMEEWKKNFAQQKKDAYANEEQKKGEVKPSGNPKAAIPRRKK